jgi:hypothetical protein
MSYKFNPFTVNLDEVSDATGGGDLTLTTATDPATNAATSTSNIDNYDGVVITTTTTGNNQTLQTPTSATAGQVFIVANHKNSTDTVDVIGTDETITLKAKDSVSFMWDGTNWEVKDQSFDNINVGRIKFDLDKSYTPEEGELYWDAEKGTLNLAMTGGTIIQIAQEQVLPDRPKNTEASQIDNGEVVYLDDATGSVPEVKLAQANASATTKAIAVATQNVGASQRGYYTTFGLVRDVPLPTATFSDGDRVYLSATVAGGITVDRPEGTNYAIEIGYIIRAHDTEGVLFVNINQRSLNYKNIRDLNVLSGINDPTKLAITYNATNRQFTVVNSGTTVAVNGVIVTPEDETTSAHADTTDQYWAVYESGATTLTITTTPSISSQAIVGRVLYNTDQGAAKAIEYEETHSQQLSAKMHENMHETVGAKFVTAPLGCAMADYTLQSDVDADMQFSLSAGEMYDEDIGHIITALATGGYSIAYRAGLDSADRMDWNDSETLPFLSGGTYIYWNENNGGTWQLTEAISNEYVNYYVFAWTRKDNTRDIIIFMGQNGYGSLELAQAESLGDLNLPSYLAPEQVPLYRLTFRAKVNYGSTGKCRIEAITDYRGEVSGASVVSGNAVDHQTLSNRDVDGHPNNAYLLGRSGGQTLIGGTDPSNNLIFQSTSDATKGIISFSDENLQDIDQLGLTGDRIVKGWFTDLESTNMPTVGGTSLNDTFAILAGASGGQILLGGTGTGEDLRLGGNFTGDGKIRFGAGANSYFDESSDDLYIDGQLKVDSIVEETADNGVLIDNVLIKDGDIDMGGTLKTDIIIEKTTDNGVSIETVILKDGDITIAGELIISATSNGISDENLNRLLSFTAAASSDNFFNITNADTGSSPIFSAIGTDSNIDINLTPKGTGGVNVGAFFLGIAEISKPSNPSANNLKIYAKDDGSGNTHLYALDSAGAETDILASASATTVTATAVITDNAIVRGDGGSRGVHDTGIIIDDSDNITLPTGASLQTNTSDANTLLLRAYDVDGSAYKTFGTLTAGNTPTFDLGVDTTLNGDPIAGFTKSTSNSLTDYPVGTIVGVWMNIAYGYDRNESNAIKYATSYDELFTNSNGTGTTLSGTWRARGVSGYFSSTDRYHLFQRVA